MSDLQQVGRPRGRPPRASGVDKREGAGGLAGIGATRTDQDREEQRPPIRNDFELSAELAKSRARELREAGVLNEELAGAFDLPSSMIRQYHDNGWSLEWKREQIAGKTDSVHMNDSKRKGWEEVPQTRHPDIIVRKEGMILMCRPLEITREAFNMNQVRARHQIENKTLELTTGAKLDQNTKDETGRPQGRVKRSVEPMTIPD